MATVAQDNFNRANGDINGDTMSDGSSTWATDEGSGMTITSNELFGATGSQDSAYCDSMDDLANGHTYCTCTSSNPSLIGPLMRRTSGGNYYWAEGYGSKVRLYKRVSGSDTQLGSDGSAMSQNDIIGVKCGEDSSDEVIATLNGSDDVTQTDSAHSTGKAGICSPSSLRAADNWVCESFVTGYPWYYEAQQRSAS